MDAPMCGHGPRTRLTAAHAWSTIAAQKCARNHLKLRILCQWAALWVHGVMVYCPKHNKPTTATTRAWECATVENGASSRFVHTFPILASTWLYKKLVTFQAEVGQTTAHPAHG